MNNKPVQHNVSLNLDITDKEVEQELFEKAEALKAIDGVTDLSFGENITPEKDRHHGFTYGLTVQFTDWDALEAYQIDPVHVEFKAFIKPYVHDVAVMDYVLWES